MANITKASSTSDASNVLSSTFYIHVSYGKIQDFYTSPKTPVNSINFQRGVASLFQVRYLRLLYMNWKLKITSWFQYQSGHWQGSEHDASGDCQVKYAPDHHGVHKIKSACKSLNGFDLSREEKILDVSTDSFSRVIYKFQGDLLESCESKEVHISEVAALRELGIIVQSYQHLHLQGELIKCPWPFHIITDVRVM